MDTVTIICEILELPIDSLDLTGCVDQSKADKELVKFKDLCKKQRRVLAKKYHPDIVKDDGKNWKMV